MTKINLVYVLKIIKKHVKPNGFSFLRTISDTSLHQNHDCVIMLQLLWISLLKTAKKAPSLKLICSLKRKNKKKTYT